MSSQLISLVAFVFCVLCFFVEMLSRSSLEVSESRSLELTWSRPFKHCSIGFSLRCVLKVFFLFGVWVVEARIARNLQKTWVNTPSSNNSANINKNNNNNSTNNNNDKHLKSGALNLTLLFLFLLPHGVCVCVCMCVFVANVIATGLGGPFR